MTNLSELEFFPYIDADGQVPIFHQGKVGVYAIFDQAQMLQCVGYSRDVYLSLRQHLVRQPQHCYWFKVATIDRPNRTLLESMRDDWIAENGSIPVGNGDHQAVWNQPIAVKPLMTPEEEQAHVAAIDDLSRGKVLKKVARRVEEEILGVLQARGLQMQIRFNPKLKESGLLDLQ